MARGGEQPQVPGGDRPASRDQELADAEIHSGLADVAAPGRDLSDDDLVAALFGVLLQGDHVRPLGDHGAGEDADARPGRQLAFEALAGPRNPDLPEPRRNGPGVLGPEGVAVHGRDRIGRMVQPRGEVGAGDAAMRLADGDDLDLHRPDRREDARAGLLHRDQA